MIQPNVEFLSAGSLPSAARPAGRHPRAAGAPENLIALVRQAEAGEPPAQTELVRRYTRRIAGFVRTIIRQPDAVEDVTQMVFIKMFRRLSRLRDPAMFESWLFTLARNTSLDFIRRRNCRPQTVALDDEINQIADPRHDDATGEILTALQMALARLSPVDRRLVTRFVAGDSYVQIADQAGLSLASVKVRLHRVRPFLRDWVGRLTDTRQPGRKGWGSAAGARLAA